jgi:glycosyltransferase involved in cell wall biosynthesis
MPKVSVVIPTYNRADFICDAIDSVLSQTYKDYEIIVVDDGSTDNTREVLKKYGDQIKYIYQENKRQGAARNNGIKHSTGEYIALLDSDDMWLPHKLEKDVACIESDDRIGVVYSNAILLYYPSNRQKKTKIYVARGDVLIQAIKRVYIDFATCGVSPTLIRKECFDKVGLFNESRYIMEDYEMLVRIASKYHFGFVNEASTLYRLHQTNDSSNFDEKKISMLKTQDVIFQNEELMPRISHLRNIAYSNVYLAIGVLYCIVGDMRTARAHLMESIRLYPIRILNRRFLASFFRTLLGKRIYFAIRKLKRFIQKRDIEGIW